MIDIPGLHRQLLDALAASGELIPPWREAFAEVPRHAFLPDTIWDDSSGELVPLHRVEDPQRWLEMAYAAEAVITQVDDGHPAGPGPCGRYVTSSASQPSVVALMLAALDAQPGMRVLEIGTGTGYNAALLTHHLGAPNVTSIEIDPHLAAHARNALATTGYPATVITGDGTRGHPTQAPYDRLIATVAVQRVPYPWVVQTRPGGMILTPWATPYHNGALVRLAVNDDGTAEGRIVGNVAFMSLRDQRFRATVTDDDCEETTARTSHTTVTPHRVAGDYDASLAIGMTVPNCTPIYVTAEHYPDAYARLWFLDPTTDSWANLVHRPGTDTHPVHQFGPRNLWDEIEAAYHWWCQAGRPGPDRWRITITPHGQHVTLTEAAPELAHCRVDGGSLTRRPPQIRT